MTVKTEFGLLTCLEPKKDSDGVTVFLFEKTLIFKYNICSYLFKFIMKKKSELVFTAIKIPLDYALLVLSGVLAYLIRINENITQYRQVEFNIDLNEIFTTSLLLSVVWLLFFAMAGLYKFRRLKITDELGKIILACSTGMSAIIIYMFFVRELFDSRFIVLTAWVLSIFLIIVARIILRKIQNISLKFGVGSHKIIIVGNNEATKELIKTFKQQPELGYKIIAECKKFDNEKFIDLHKKYFIDEIIQTDSSLSRAESIELINFSENNNIIFKYAAGTFEARTTNIDVHMIAGIPLIEIRKTKLDGWGKIAKRLIDFIYSIILIVVLSPVMLIILLAIKIESRGPAIFRNERVSRHGKFHVFKFRSMYADYCIGKEFEKFTDQKKIIEFEKDLIKKQSERKGPVYKILNDPRRTKVGRFIERTSLDELPQLFNVLIGNMSLVGPRPHQPREVEKYEMHHKRVLDIKPGITGLAQISGRSDLDFEDEVKLDTYYIENWSLKLDFWIMLKTPLVVLSRKSKV